MSRQPLPYLTPERALIFRLTHIDNLEWTLKHGLVCQTSPIKDPTFRRIGSADVIGKRLTRKIPVPPGGVLADYVPFYFTPLSMMMLNIVSGYRGIEQVPARELIVMATSVIAVEEAGIPFVFTDRHALLDTARFSSSLADLPNLIDWKLLQLRDFTRDPEDPGKKERYQAEALIHGSLPVQLLTGLACSSPSQIERLEARVKAFSLDLKVIAKSEWYFQ